MKQPTNIHKLELSGDFLNFTLAQVLKVGRAAWLGKKWETRQKLIKSVNKSK